MDDADDASGNVDGERKRVPCKRPRQQIASQTTTQHLVDTTSTEPTADAEASDSSMEDAIVDNPSIQQEPDEDIIVDQNLGEQTAVATDDDAAAGDEDKVWSAMVEIDPGFPFEIIWPLLQESVRNALKSVHSKWADMGWRSSGEMEETLRQAVEKEGVGAIARGLRKAEAESVAQQLNGQMNCFVRMDREGAAAAAAAIASNTVSANDTDRRERIRQRIRELRDGDGGFHQFPMFADILDRLDADIDDDERWHSLAPAMEHMLERMQSRGNEVLRSLITGGLPHPMKRVIKILVDRNRPLMSTLWPMLRASPDDLRPGRLRIKYKGEEGEDGEGGGGVTRVFFTQVGKYLTDIQLGLLLPSPGGYFQLSPHPGFFSSHAREFDSVFSRPDSWSKYLGRMIGMAVVHECPLGFLLVPSLCKQLLGKEPSFEDLRFAPGLNDAGAGWYNSLRSMLAHRAPDLVTDGESMPQMETDVVNNALIGLQAVMMSRSQQTFESLASFVSSAAHTPHLWESSIDVAACLMHKGKTMPQRSLAIDTAKSLLEGIIAGSNTDIDISPEMLRALKKLGVVCNVLGHQTSDVATVYVLVQRLLSYPDDSMFVEDEEGDACQVRPSDLKPLRPQTIPSVTEWFTTGAKDLMRSTGKLYHEVELDEDFFDPAPQLGWLTGDFVEQDGDGNGVGDDTHGWAADGVRHKKWHDGHKNAEWPRYWRGGDVIGLAIDIEAGNLQFALNGEWVTNAQMSLTADGRSFYPAVSMKGKFVMHISQPTWQFKPPGDDYEAWANSGVFTRPIVAPTPAEPPALERQVSHVEGPGLSSGEQLFESNLQAFAQAVTHKALTQNLKPFLDIVVSEFSNVVPQRLRQSLVWQDVQERVSGQRLDPAAFVQVWREKTTYQNCDESTVSVLLWWNYVSDRSAGELLRLFSWCTGYAAVPVTSWKFQIKLVDDCGLCPTVNTCLTDDPSAANRGVKMPTLYLPAYDSTAVLAHKMEWAVEGATAINLI